MRAVWRDESQIVFVDFAASSTAIIEGDRPAGASALTGGLRGELPGRSACGHGVASPFGSLCFVVSLVVEDFTERHTVVLDLLVVLDRHLCGLTTTASDGLYNFP